MREEERRSLDHWTMELCLFWSLSWPMRRSRRGELHPAVTHPAVDLDISLQVLNLTPTCRQTHSSVTNRTSREIVMWHHHFSVCSPLLSLVVFVSWTSRWCSASSRTLSALHSPTDLRPANRSETVPPETCRTQTSCQIWSLQEYPGHEGTVSRQCCPLVVGVLITSLTAVIHTIWQLLPLHQKLQ